MVWSAMPICKCAGTGTMPVIGWPGRSIICSCAAGKFLAHAKQLEIVGF